MGQVAFVVWRECFEALLVIGIIYAWMAKQEDRSCMRYLWGGVLLHTGGSDFSIGDLWGV